MLDQVFGEGRGRRVGQLIMASLVLFSVFLIAKILIDFKKLPGAGNEVYPQSTISVSGSGEAYAIPDVATFSFGVEETAKTVQGAQDGANKKISAALDVIKSVGVEDKDVKTVDYSVYPKYEYSSAVCPRPMSAAYNDAGLQTEVTSAIYCPPDKQTLTGYTVSQMITVKVRDTSKVGDLVTKVGAVGVSNISGISFVIDKPDEYMAQARAQAIDEAKAKAKEIAKQLGVRLGKILYYGDGGEQPYAYGMRGAADSMKSLAVPAAPAELPQGQTKITSNVTITYELK